VVAVAGPILHHGIGIIVKVEGEDRSWRAIILRALLQRIGPDQIGWPGSSNNPDFVEDAVKALSWSATVADAQWSDGTVDEWAGHCELSIR
jgi:hypothetical protein